MRTRVFLIWGVVCWMACVGWGFNGHVGTEGPIKVTIGEVETVGDFDEPVEVEVTVENTSEKAVAVRLEAGGLVDEWYAVGDTVKEVICEAKGRREVTFRIACGRGAVSALWPVHVWAEFCYGGKRGKVHCVQIFESDFRALAARVSKEMPVVSVPAVGGVSLCNLKGQRVVWRFFDKQWVGMPVGWKGTDGESGTNFSVGTVYRGTGKEAITMHPAWRGAAGTVFAEYAMQLPKTERIEFHFANAIRDHSVGEPASDGVTFRVWAGDEELFERHTDSKRWMAGKVDLSRFAGRRIMLRLESHPGPKKNTTCDSSYWGEPVIIAGEPPRRLEAEQKELLGRQARWHLNPNSLMSERPRGAVGSKAFLFDAGDDWSAAVVPGVNGIFDAAIAFGNGDKCVVFEGIDAAVLERRIGASSGVVVEEVEYAGTTITHRLLIDGKRCELKAKMYSDRGGLRIRFECDRRISDLALGAADQKARRVYYGHGYCIEAPKAFRAGFGGHNLSTSHVGFDFEKGISLLMATDNPPDYLQVLPEKNIYALHTHHNATLTFVAGTKGAFDCAVRYQDLYDKKPSPGFAKKAGRLVFDIWGGRYAEIAETMQRMVDYGLTDSLLTVHVWQRWGYDYRLPDIYPPNPAYGTVEDMKKIGAVCDGAGIPWGLHDNYIDFYPDAEDYSYDDICFTESGEPIKAWINEYRGAQSYRWRPDRFMPFLQRNLRLIKRELAPSHYFIDVFTSIGCFDYYDKAGGFHSALETRRCWGESFRWIQDYLGGAVTTSEAGHDQLVGYLDGADCQHLTISTTGARFTNRIACGKWQRTPWFDAVLHDKFSLHGVGYPSRYKLTEYDDHPDALETDDYISAEILAGHAMMIDRRAFGRGAVRKYWLGQDFVRSVATDRIAGVEFAGDDIDRQIVRWRSGAKVHVNRGREDWKIAGKVLPQYGYYAVNGEIESSIERIGGVIVERASNGSTSYYNGRGFGAEDRLGIRPEAASVEHLGGRRFKMVVDWDVTRRVSKDLDVFVHFVSDDSERSDKIAFQGDMRPYPATSKWKGRMTTGGKRVIYIPGECGAGEYEIRTGVWDPKVGVRYQLVGDDAGGLSYKLGTLVVEGEGGEVTGLKLVKHEPPVPPKSRRNQAGVPVDFGEVVTAGAFRCEVKTDCIMVTPLPDTGRFEVTLRINELTGGRRAKVAGVAAVARDGKRVRDVKHDWKDGAVAFDTGEDEFGYRISCRGH